MPILFLFAACAILVLAIIPHLVIRARFTENMRDSFRWMVENGQRYLPFSATRTRGAGKGFIFCPHPFTNWSLNPSYLNDRGESEHTVEGFRKTEDVDSIIEMSRRYSKAYKIVCIGGSSTYCSNIARFRDTWPSRLNEKLKDKNCAVFNFGVGGWNTLQSSVRCAAWLPAIRPQAVVFYQAKNDLTPVYNGAEKEEGIYPDYQNVMGQYQEFFNLRFPGWMAKIPFFSLLEINRIDNKHMSCIYNKPKAWLDPKAFGRVTDGLIDAILFRVEVIISMCAALDSKVIYVPEIIRSGPYRERLESIYSRVPDIVSRYKNASLHDARGTDVDSDRCFWDKGHFSETGCEVFAGFLAGKVVRMRDGH